MNLFLTGEQAKLLMDICRSAGRHSLCIAEKLMNSSISSNETDELCELISNEFLLNGIQEDFEPNDYGEKLEELLDAVNKWRLHDG